MQYSSFVCSGLLVHQSQQVMAALGQQTWSQARCLLQQAKEVQPLVQGVITGTRRRALESKKMASEQKAISLFESHTRHPRHKGGDLVEFGRQVILNGVEGGMVTRCQILEHPTEHGQALPTLARFRYWYEKEHDLKGPMIAREGKHFCQKGE